MKADNPLRISEKEVDSLGTLRLHDFKKRVFSLLVNSFPEYCSRLGTQGVIDLVNGSVIAAKAYGITKQRAVFKFACLGLLAGSDFHQKEPVKRILTDEQIDPSLRVDVLYYSAQKQLNGEW